MKPDAIIPAAVLTHAVRALSAVLAGTTAADAALSQHFREHRTLGQADRGWIAEIVYAVLRQRRSLAAAAQSELPRDLALAALLRVLGLSGRRLEAILKRDDQALVERLRNFDATSLLPAQRADLPDWLWLRLCDEFGADAAQSLARALKQSAPLTLRVNGLKATRESVLAALDSDSIAAAPTAMAPLGIRLTGKPALARHPLFTSGQVEVQDEGSQLLAELLGPRRGEMVADFCAGAGGKTLALGALMRSTGRLYAFDVSAARLARMKPRVARSGLSNVHPVRIDSEADPRVGRLAGKLDRVLVDAPCSGVGTLRRNPEIKWRQDAAQVGELAQRQARILASAARLVKQGGRLVYATCSLLREENQSVVDAFVQQHPGFVQGDARAVLAERGIAVACAGPALVLLPDRDGTDGFYAAVLERRS
ncbi:MAG: RsmB/NOP family class I SAM-dependent RNA methyltransferase [Burkholderiales bacterium]|nr:RsmB/NOP family class I SAM-dependent RNA methyltransferase [Burkholderiales bacterium]